MKQKDLPNKWADVDRASRFIWKSVCWRANYDDSANQLDGWKTRAG